MKKNYFKFTQIKLVKFSKLVGITPLNSLECKFKEVKLLMLKKFMIIVRWDKSHYYFLIHNPGINTGAKLDTCKIILQLSGLINIPVL